MDDISAVSLLDLGFEETQTTERYDLQEVIFEGGMGKITKAYDSKTDRYVAYKSVKSGAPYQLELRFRYEAEVTARLEHPNIMPVYDIGQDSSGRPFYTMKLLKGQTLADYLNKQEKSKQTLKQSLDILIKVCDAVAFAHKNHIIHRDLKPDNIIIGDYGEVLVLDWGIAKVQHAKDQFAENEELINLSSNLTQCGSVMGTPAYMSPEQTVDAEKADVRSDIYALGAIFFKMLTFKDPFVGKTPNEIMTKVKKGEVETVEESIPVSALAVCQKAMSLASPDRYQNVEELAHELGKLQGGFTVSAENASLLKILITTCKRNKAVSISTAFFLTVLISVIFFTVSRINDQKTLAEYNFQKAQEALADLKKASPVYLDRAKHSIAIGKFDDALIDIRTYLSLNCESQEAYFLLGRINQGQMKFKEATAAFQKANSLVIGKKIVTCVSALEISKTAWGAASIDGAIAPDDKLSVYMSLVNNMQLPEAAALLDDILKDRKYSMKVYSALFEKSDLKGKLGYSKSGMMHMTLNKENNDISTLRHFRTANIGLLSLAGAQISDISVLSNLKIISLDISGTRVARLNDLTDGTLQELNCANSRVQTIVDIKGRTFKKLNLSRCPLKDLTPLLFINVDELDLSGCPAENPKIISGILHRTKKITLPSKWKSLITNIPKTTEVIWSDLEAPILQ
jgi:serine/threonine protein kinase